MSENKQPTSQTNNQSLNLNTTDQESQQIIDEVVDHIEKLPPAQQQMAMAKLEMYSGPIPHPDILKQYDEINPGAAQLIIENGVEESKHRRKLETDSLLHMSRDRKRRDWMGFIIALVIVFVGALLIYLDHVITGSILSGVSALGIVGLFLDHDTSNHSNERSEE